ncbi:TolC family protein [Aggregicoccus sp. 17bor-14]|uniref:TolC family protein n=1 Tax=Myxococcaceae TaxID=31 RepID=UPI00129C1832|nr:MULTISPECIES: TolC family protein [Myxococcaceae]MBF5043064.1 TolC family protein [Simulacricoccus sp. 17bor-14]MRI88827.1 TolC family protein [Aggregicoccus sp. 17bor-14]
MTTLRSSVSLLALLGASAALAQTPAPTNTAPAPTGAPPAAEQAPAPSAQPPALRPGENPSAPTEVKQDTTRRVVSLKEALALAAKQSPDVAAARAQAEQADAAVSRAWAAWRPDVSASGQLVRSSAPAIFNFGDLITGIGKAYGLTPVNQAAIDALSNPITINAEWSRLATVQISQPLFSPQGAFLVGPAKTGAEAASLGAQEAREQVLLGVARTYLGLKGINQAVQAAQEAEAVALRRERDANAQIRAGVAVEVALLRAQAETAQARAQLANLYGQREGLLAVLQSLTGEAIQPDPQSAPETELGVSGRQEEKPWLQAFSVRSAQKAVQAAEGVTRFDKYAWLPTVAAIGRGNYNSNSGFTGKNVTYDVLLAANLPLYDRGLRYAAKHENEAKLAQARANFEGSRARAEAAWISARANITAAEAQAAQAESQAELATRVQKQVEASAQAGVATSLELSDADTRRFLATSNAAQARAAVDIRRAELAAAEGRLAAYINAEPLLK